MFSPTGMRLFWSSILVIATAGALAADPVELSIPKAHMAPPGLEEEEQRRVDQAVERGVTYLRAAQLKTGSWILGAKGVGESVGTAQCPMGLAALAGLALLECGVRPGDDAVRKAAGFVRSTAPGSFRTYEISLAIVFLDKLGEKTDRPLIRSLALRLAAGQSALGGWGYNCPLLTAPQEKKLAAALSERGRDEVPMKLEPPKPRGPGEKADNSNTQFAILALWIARKYDLKLEFPLAFSERRFRISQEARGWSYGFGSRGHYAGSMTCAGLLGLAVGRALASEEPEKKDAGPKVDDGIKAGLTALATYMNDPSDAGLRSLGPPGLVNLYFLWSVERVGVFCNLETIGGKNWYRWGVEVLLKTQEKDGRWLGRGSGGFSAVDTSFALLFLRRADLTPGLREALLKRVTIVDPAQEPEALPKKKRTDKTETGKRP